jgi:hypothetical protein
MNPEHLTSLKQAADLIKLGKTKPARGLIIDVLRADPDNVQAWYMLSFAVPKVDRQIYALQQTIRLEPDHQKAISRLEKLGGEIPDPSKNKETAEPFLSPIDPPTPEPTQRVADPTEEDLLSQRLFGESISEEKISAPGEEQEQSSKPPVFYHEIAEQVDPDTTDQTGEETEIPTGDIPHQIIFGIPRKFFLIGIGFLIILFLVILGFSPQLIDLIKNASPNQQAGISTLESQIQPTETSLPQPTATTIPPTPTFVPTKTPLVRELFTTSDLQPPAEDSISEIESIETGIKSLLNISTGSDPTVFTISEPRLQPLIWDFAKLDGFANQVQNNQKFFEILGLAEPGNDFSSFYQNIWIDPNGTLFLPEQNIIALVGFEFSDYQKYSFAQAYVQSVRNQQYSYNIFDLYPPCLAPSEECEINLALVKGESSFTAWQWALEALDEQVLNTIDLAARKLYISPVFSPPAVMESIRLFPYDQGYTFVEKVFEQGGWESVENLYTNPPTTTEQILHPEKYFSSEVGADIDFSDLSTILPSEWQPIFQDSLGEWKTYLLLTAGTNLFTRINENDAQLASEGWNGDYTQIFTTLTGKSIVIAHWKFDSLEDTAEFNSAFGQYTSSRVNGETIELNGFSCIKDISQISCLITQGDNVIWLFGPDSETIELILENYAFFTN